MARRTKRRTGRKSRRSTKRSIKRELEKSLRKTIERSIKKSLKKFTKRIKKHKKKKTKKKKIQRGGAGGGEEERVALIIQSLETMKLPENKKALKKLKKSLGKDKTSLKNPDEEGSHNRRANVEHTTIAFKKYGKTLSQINDPEILTLSYYANTIIMIINTLHEGVIPKNIKDLFIVLLNDEEFNQIYIPFILYIFATLYESKPPNREVLKELMETPKVIEYFKVLTGVSNIADVISLIGAKLDDLDNNLGGATEKVRKLLIDMNIFNIEELGNPAAAQVAAAQVAAAQVAAPVAAPAGPAQELEQAEPEPALLDGLGGEQEIEPQQQGDEDTEGCELARKVTILTKKLEECEAAQEVKVEELGELTEEANKRGQSLREANKKVRELERDLASSQRKVDDLSRFIEKQKTKHAQALKVEAARMQGISDEMANRRHLQHENELNELKYYIEQLEKENEQIQRLETELSEAVGKARAAKIKADEAAKKERLARQSVVEKSTIAIDTINKLEKDIKRLLKERACSTLAEIIIDCKLKEDEVTDKARRAGGVEAGRALIKEEELASAKLNENRYGLLQNTLLKHIKIAVRLIAKALGYVEVEGLYRDVHLSQDSENVTLQGVINNLVKHIYQNNPTLIAETMSRIESEFGGGQLQQPAGELAEAGGVAAEPAVAPGGLAAPAAAQVQQVEEVQQQPAQELLVNPSELKVQQATPAQIAAPTQVAQPQLNLSSFKAGQLVTWKRSEATLQDLGDIGKKYVFEGKTVWMVPEYFALPGDNPNEIMIVLYPEEVGGARQAVADIKDIDIIGKLDESGHPDINIDPVPLAQEPAPAAAPVGVVEEAPPVDLSSFKVGQLVTWKGSEKYLEDKGLKPQFIDNDDKTVWLVPERFEYVREVTGNNGRIMITLYPEREDEGAFEAAFEAGWQAIADIKDIDIIGKLEDDGKPNINVFEVVLE